jgi:hypothetical protein
MPDLYFQCVISAPGQDARFSLFWKAAAGISAKRKPLLNQNHRHKTAASLLLQQPKTRVADMA